MFDILLLLIAAAAQLGLAYLGVKVSAIPPKTTQELSVIKWAFIIVALIGFAAVVGGGIRSSSVQQAIADGVEKIERRLASSQSSEPGLFVECNDVVLPVIAPADGRFFQLQVQKNSSNGLAEVLAETGKEYRLTQFGIRHRCQITNYDNAPAIKTSVELSLKFRKQIEETGQIGDTTLIQKNTINIGKIDSGAANPFVFYIANFSDDFVEIKFPDFASIHRLGDSKPQSVPMTTNRNFLMIAPLAKPKVAQ